MAGDLFLGIDCGTQGLKTLLLDGATGAVVAFARKDYKTNPSTEPGVSEQDPAIWIDAVKVTIRKIVASIGSKRAARIAAVAVSGQQHGMVAVDGAGKVIRPAKLWNDTSTAAEAASIIRKFGGAASMIQRYGNAPPPGFTASKVLWFSKTERRNYETCASVLLPHDYINFWLTGEKAAEAGDASGTGYFNIHQRKYASEICKFLGRGFDAKIPNLVDAGATVGVVRESVAKILNLPKGVQVGHGGGDNMMAALGTGAVREGIVTISLGTSGTAFTFSKKAVADPRGEIAGFCDSTGGYLPLLCIQNCTNATEAVKNLLKINNNELEQLASRGEPGSDGMLLLPFFGGERTPNLPGAKGALVGLDIVNFSRERLARAAIEAPTLGLAFGMQRFRELGVDTKEVRLTGGGSKSKLWRRICASSFGAPVVTLQIEEGAALGAAICAAWCAERTKNRKIAASDVAERYVSVNSASRVSPDASEVKMYQSIARERARWIEKLYL